MLILTKRSFLAGDPDILASESKIIVKININSHKIIVKFIKIMLKYLKDIPIEHSSSCEGSVL